MSRSKSRPSAGVLGQFWDSQIVTLRDIARHCVMPSDCCAWPLPSHIVDP